MTDSDTMTEPTEQHTDDGTNYLLRVVRPQKAQYSSDGQLINGWVYNGYEGRRVYVGQETQIPVYRPFRDEDGNHLRNPDGTLKWKKQAVPKWAELVKIVPPPRGWEPLEAAPALAVAPIAKATGKAQKPGSTKSFGGSGARAARPSDTPIG